MTDYKKRKTVVTWTSQQLKAKMSELGFKVEYIDKPETIENVRSRPFESDLNPITLDEDSDKRIQKYLIDSKADGGLVINSTHREGKYYSATSVEGHITIQPYKLIKI